MDKKRRVKRIFDSISGKYDFLNHFLSAGIDFYWRKKALDYTGINKNAALLDIACGTGDFAISARKRGIKNIYGADLSLNMLRLFQKKAGWIKGNNIQGVAEFLPFKDFSFTNITVAFGVRNFYDISEGFREFFRILNHGGKVTVLEFSLPSNFLVRSFYLFYFKFILPFLGKIVSKDKEAYQYLPDSVSEFDSSVDISALLLECGFKNVQSKTLTFGIVKVVVAEK